MIRKYSITLYTLALLIAMTAWTAAASEKGKSPEAVYPETIYRFDPIMEGVEIKHDFQIENHGDAPLVIQKVQPD